MESRGFAGGLSLFGEGNEGVFRGGEVIIGGKRGSSAKNAGDFGTFCYETGEAQSGIFRGVFLEISAFVGFVDDDEAEIFDGGEQGRARTDDDLGGRGIEQIFPDEMALRFGLF